MSEARPIRVLVVFARPQEVFLRDCELPAGAVIGDALRAAGLLEAYPEIDWAAQPVGVYGRVLPQSQPLADGDRVEVYRPLEARSREAGTADEGEAVTP